MTTKRLFVALFATCCIVANLPSLSYAINAKSISHTISIKTPERPSNVISHFSPANHKYEAARTLTLTQGTPAVQFQRTAEGNPNYGNAEGQSYHSSSHDATIVQELTLEAVPAPSYPEEPKKEEALPAVPSHTEYEESKPEEASDAEPELRHEETTLEADKASAQYASSHQSSTVEEQISKGDVAPSTAYYSQKGSGNKNVLHAVKVNTPSKVPGTISHFTPADHSYSASRTVKNKSRSKATSKTTGTGFNTYPTRSTSVKSEKVAKPASYATSPESTSINKEELAAPKVTSNSNKNAAGAASSYTSAQNGIKSSKTYNVRVRTPQRASGVISHFTPAGHEYAATGNFEFKKEAKKVQNSKQQSQGGIIPVQIKTHSESMQSITDSAKLESTDYSIHANEPAISHENKESVKYENPVSVFVQSKAEESKKYAAPVVVPQEAEALEDEKYVSSVASEPTTAYTSSAATNKKQSSQSSQSSNLSTLTHTVTVNTPKKPSNIISHFTPAGHTYKATATVALTRQSGDTSSKQNYSQYQTVKSQDQYNSDSSASIYSAPATAAAPTTATAPAHKSKPETNYQYNTATSSSSTFTKPIPAAAPKPEPAANPISKPKPASDLVPKPIPVVFSQYGTASFVQPATAAATKPATFPVPKPKPATNSQYNSASSTSSTYSAPAPAAATKPATDPVPKPKPTTNSQYNSASSTSSTYSDPAPAAAQKPKPATATVPRPVPVVTSQYSSSSSSSSSAYSDPASDAVITKPSTDGDHTSTSEANSQHNFASSTSSTSAQSQDIGVKGSAHYSSKNEQSSNEQYSTETAQQYSDSSFEKNSAQYSAKYSAPSTPSLIPSSKTKAQKSAVKTKTSSNFSAKDLESEHMLFRSEAASPVRAASIHLKEENEGFMPYTFSINVADDESTNYQDRYETVDDDGVTHGWYSVLMPDNFVYKYTYTADPVKGYQVTASRVDNGISVKQGPSNFNEPATRFSDKGIGKFSSFAVSGAKNPASAQEADNNGDASLRFAESFAETMQVGSTKSASLNDDISNKKSNINKGSLLKESSTYSTSNSGSSYSSENSGSSSYSSESAPSAQTSHYNSANTVPALVPQHEASKYSSLSSTSPTHSVAEPAAATAESENIQLHSENSNSEYEASQSDSYNEQLTFSEGQEDSSGIHQLQGDSSSFGIFIDASVKETSLSETNLGDIEHFTDLSTIINANEQSGPSQSSDTHSGDYDSSSQSANQYESDSSSQSANQHKTDSSSQSANHYESDSSFQSGNQPETDSRSQSANQYESDYNSQSANQHETDSNSQSANQYKSDSNSQSANQHETDSNSQSVNQYESDYNSQSANQYETDSSSQSDNQYASDSSSQSENQYKAEHSKGSEVQETSGELLHTVHIYTPQKTSGVIAHFTPTTHNYAAKKTVTTSAGSASGNQQAISESVFVYSQSAPAVPIGAYVSSHATEKEEEQILLDNPTEVLIEEAHQIISDTNEDGSHPANAYNEPSDIASISFDNQTPTDLDESDSYASSYDMEPSKQIQEIPIVPSVQEIPATYDSPDPANQNAEQETESQTADAEYANSALRSAVHQSGPGSVSVTHSVSVDTPAQVSSVISHFSPATHQYKAKKTVTINKSL